MRSERLLMHCRRFSIDAVSKIFFSQENHTLAIVDEFLTDPLKAIGSTDMQNFAAPTPHYPGVRAPLESEVMEQWLDVLSPVLSALFDAPDGRWSMRAWRSIVTTPPARLQPIQRLPHVDGLDPDQIAMMLYLHDTDHGGTAFFRHRATGLEALTAATFPAYRERLEEDIAKTGLPPRAYVTDGAPHFERTLVTDGRFNQAVFYRGNILHSGVIDNELPLPCDAREGRLTINAFLRPPQSTSRRG